MHRAKLGGFSGKEELVHDAHMGVFFLDKGDRELWTMIGQSNVSDLNGP